MMDKHGTLNVSGTGNVQVSPDEAVIHLDLVTESKTAAEATAHNAAATQKLIDAVSAQPNHGVTTAGVSVTPILRHDQSTGGNTIVGFRATNWVEAKTKVGYAGQLYDAGMKAGATESSGIRFRIQNEAPYREQALRLAVEVAFREAKVVASSAHLELMGIESIQIGSAGERVIYRAKAVDVGAVTTPVMPEDRTISATVQIVFGARG